MLLSHSLICFSLSLSVCESVHVCGEGKGKLSCVFWWLTLIAAKLLSPVQLARTCPEVILAIHLHNLVSYLSQ